MNKPYAITLDVGTSLANRTGAWRTERPVYVDRLPPCNNACPAGENCQGWLFFAEEGRYREGWEAIMVDNPLPAIMGRACYHPCETSCSRATLDEAVNIHAVERFIGDLAIKEGWKATAEVPPSGKKILIVGAGPSGLSAAYHLIRMGHAVTVVEAGSLPGGMMRFGIPKYRLPRDIIDAEIQRIIDMGVTLELNRAIDDVPAEMKRGSYDACFIAIGAHLAKRVDIPAPDAGRILDALSVLRGMETGSDTPDSDAASAPVLGRRVVVYGGGNTALDVARTAKRLGRETVIVYRRTRKEMPAHDFEVQEAVDEGITIHWLRTIKEMGESSFTVEKMKLDDQGWPQPTGEYETIEGDTVILALGQNVETDLLKDIPGIEFSKDGVVAVAENMMTGHEGIFAGGDMVPSERTITVAVGHGKRAARYIDAYVRGMAYEAPPKHELVTFDLLNPWYYTDASKLVQPALNMVRRQTTFEEVVGGLDIANALLEARRCLSCGNCFECDNCFGVCPDNAVIKLGAGQRYEINYDFCKGCGMCAAECPCGAIQMVPEAV